MIMSAKSFCLLSMLCIFVQYTKTQYLQFKSSNTLPRACQNAVLVEHFFNLVFSEFHNTPPACVCVRMCIDQPTYCYPNGCIKKEVKRNTDKAGYSEDVAPMQEDKSKPVTFVVPDQSNYLPNFIDGDYFSDQFFVKSEKPQVKGMRPDPFKDRFKILSKYKRIPNFHLRYNLRDQVKNAKSDQAKFEKVDVSKTRWPAHKSMLDYNQYFTGVPTAKNSENGNNKYTVPLVVSNPNRFFHKRDLSMMKQNPNITDFNVSDEIKDGKDNPGLLLENLIEYLIESTFTPDLNNSNLNFKTNLEPVEKPTTVLPTPPTRRYIYLLTNATIILNETTNVVSPNLTDENRPRNKYLDDFNPNETYKNVFREMIETLSKSIEQQNNGSAELMEKLIGNTIEEATDTTLEVTTIDDPTSTVKETMPIIEEASIQTTTDKAATIVPAVAIAKTEVTHKIKSRQRLIRKLHNSKVN